MRMPLNRKVESVLNGYNATVFAYGATGSGKTYTMIGNQIAGPGVMVLTMRDLFHRIHHSESHAQYRVRISYLEIYNETIRDLLNPDENKKSIEMREDNNGRIMVAGLKIEEPTSAEEVMELLQRGNAARSQSATEANANSSRSHAVLQIYVERRDLSSNVSTECQVAKLSMIDLAGSERAAVTKNRGTTLREGANINQSLLALGNCINALCLAGAKTSFVPYRNSKLTRLLKDSLGGNCKTVMIAAVSPSRLSFEDTHNTLKYANRAKNIKTMATRNVMNIATHITEYKTLILKLREENTELKSRLHTIQASNPNAEPFEQDECKRIHLRLRSLIQDHLASLQNLSDLDVHLAADEMSYREQCETSNDLAALERMREETQKAHGARKNLGKRTEDCGRQVSAFYMQSTAKLSSSERKSALEEMMNAYTSQKELIIARQETKIKKVSHGSSSEAIQGRKCIGRFGRHMKALVHALDGVIIPVIAKECILAWNEDVKRERLSPSLLISLDLEDDISDSMPEFDSPVKRTSDLQALVDHLESPCLVRSSPMSKVHTMVPFNVSFEDTISDLVPSQTRAVTAPSTMPMPMPLQLISSDGSCSEISSSRPGRPHTTAAMARRHLLLTAATTQLHSGAQRVAHGNGGGQGQQKENRPPCNQQGTPRAQSKRKSLARQIIMRKAWAMSARKKATPSSRTWR